MREFEKVGGVRQELLRKGLELEDEEKVGGRGKGKVSQKERVEVSDKKKGS